MLNRYAGSGSAAYAAPNARAAAMKSPLAYSCFAAEARALARSFESGSADAGTATPISAAMSAARIRCGPAHSKQGAWYSQLGAVRCTVTEPEQSGPRTQA